jgi:hypothetical protein
MQIDNKGIAIRKVSLRNKVNSVSEQVLSTPYISVSSRTIRFLMEESI